MICLMVISMTELQERIFRRRLGVLEGVVAELLNVIEPGHPAKVAELRERLEGLKTKLLETEEKARG